jgi:hypothetical protein
MQKRRGWESREMEGMRHHFCLVRGLTWAASGSVFKSKAGHASRVTQDKEEMLYLVEAVIGERRVHVQGESMPQVLVMWRNYGLSAATWEPLLNIPSEFVDKFKKGELPDPAIFDSDNEVPTETCERQEQGEMQFTPSANPQRCHVGLEEEPIHGARMNRNGDGRERHSADPRGLDGHRNNQKMLKIKKKAERHGSSGSLAGGGGRVGMDKTRRSGDRRGPIPLGLDKAEAREQRVCHLARHHRFQLAENLNVLKQAGGSYGEFKCMAEATCRCMSEKEKARWEAPASAGVKAGSVTAAKEDGSDTRMGEHVSGADDASEGDAPPEFHGACLNGGSSEGAGANHLARKGEETGNFTLERAACGTGMSCGSLPRPKSKPMLSASLRGSGATDLDAYERRTRLVTSMEEDDEDAASENGEDEDEKSANGELAKKRKASRANGGKCRSVDQVCAEKRQVGWLQVSLCVCSHA